MDRLSAKKPDKFLLWVDAVGGYWVCLGDRVTLGQPAGSRKVDIPILGDVSKRHAAIRRDGEGYLIEAYRPVRVEGREVHGVMSLTDGDEIQLGNVVKLAFRRPHALSATARLDFVSRHRTEPSVDGLVLMADSCVLGPRRHCHIVCRDWANDVVLYRHDDELYCRTVGRLEIDGVKTKGRGRITRRSRVSGDRFSFTLEEVPGAGQATAERIQ